MDLIENGGSQEQYFAETYAQLRQIARRERGKQSAAKLDTTAVVHEAWLKLNARDPAFNDRRHYLGTAALAMRQILVEYARYSLAEKRNPAHEVASSANHGEVPSEQPVEEAADLLFNYKSVQGSTAIELIAPTHCPGKTLDHPGIALLLDGGLDDVDNPYLVMECDERQSITRYARELMTLARHFCRPPAPVSIRICVSFAPAPWPQILANATRRCRN